MAGMGDFYHALPKAELHVHLEGSIEPGTLRELAPALSPEEIARRYQYVDFLGFLKSFEWVTGHLRTPSDYALATRRLLDRLESENVQYAEIIFSAGVVLWRNLELAPIFNAIRHEAIGRKTAVRWLFDAVRQFGAEHVTSVAKAAAARVDDGVVGFGIGGDEARGPAGLFRGAFALAREAGLRLTAHAGETAGPDSVWAALEAGAERIGHGIRSVEDPVLVKHLCDHDVPLEVSISSNVRTGAVASLKDHPIRRLYDAGVPITLNSDDPAMFETTLVREYEIAAREFGFSKSDLERIAGNGFRYAFGTKRA